MKKTLVALLALGALAFGEDPARALITTTTAYGTACDAGYYEAISFVLSGDVSRLTTTTGVLPATGSAELTSIEVADRATKIADSSHAGKYAILTDASNIIIGFSQQSVMAKTKHYDDWGWDYTRVFASYMGFQDYYGNALNLTIGNEYHVYFATTQQLLNIVISKRELIQSGDRVAEMGFFAATDGKMPSGTARELGFMSNGMRVAQAYAPLVGVAVTLKETPEPATGTLGLLALCALASRKRRK